MCGFGSSLHPLILIDNNLITSSYARTKIRIRAMIDAQKCFEIVNYSCGKILLSIRKRICSIVRCAFLLHISIQHVSSYFGFVFWSVCFTCIK